MNNKRKHQEAFTDVKFESAKRLVALRLTELQTAAVDSERQKEFCIALRDAKLVILPVLEMFGVSFQASSDELLMLGEKGLELVKNLKNVDANVIAGIARHNREIREGLEKACVEVA